MKSFFYAEDTEGGMCPIFFNQASELSGLYGWMCGDCVHQDTALTNWMETAEVGDTFDHRLGIAVRLKDENDG